MAAPMRKGSRSYLGSLIQHHTIEFRCSTAIEDVVDAAGN